MTDIRLACAALSAVAEPSRIRILDLLRTGPQTSGAIARHLAVPPQNASHHLNLMRLEGLVQSVKDGRVVTYNLHPAHFRRGKGGRGDALDLHGLVLRWEAPPCSYT